MALPIASFSAENSVVVLDTSLGSIEIELFDQKAPIGTKNFLNYVKSGFYKDVIFHRIIKGFMVQVGGFDSIKSCEQARTVVVNNSGMSERYVEYRKEALRLEPHTLPKRWYPLFSVPTACYKQ